MTNLKCLYTNINSNDNIILFKAGLNLKPDQNIKILILTLWYPLGIQELSHRCFRVIFAFLPYEGSYLK